MSFTGTSKLGLSSKSSTDEAHISLSQYKYIKTTSWIFPTRYVIQKVDQTNPSTTFAASGILANVHCTDQFPAITALRANDRLCAITSPGTQQQQKSKEEVVLCLHKDKSVLQQGSASLGVVSARSDALQESNPSMKNTPALHTTSPLALPIPTKRNNEFAKLWKAAMAANKHAEIAELLQFPIYSLVKYIEWSEKAKELMKFASEDLSLFAAPDDLDNLLNIIKAGEDTIAKYTESMQEDVLEVARRLQEAGSKQLVETLYFFYEMSESLETLDFTTIQPLVKCLWDIEGRVRTAAAGLRRMRSRTRRGQQKQVWDQESCTADLQIFAAGILAVGYLNKMLERHPEVINDNVNALFGALFDTVVSTLSHVENFQNGKLGYSLGKLSLETRYAAINSLGFVAIAEESGERVRSLGCFIIKDKKGYRRSNICNAGIDNFEAISQNAPPSQLPNGNQGNNGVSILDKHSTASAAIRVAGFGSALMSATAV